MSQDEKIKSKLHQQLTIFETVSTFLQEKSQTMPLANMMGGMKRWNIKEGNKEFRFANDFIPLRGASGRMFTSFYPSCPTTGVPETRKIWFHKFCWSWSPLSPDLLYASTSITIVIPPALILTYPWIWFKCQSTESIVKMKVKLCLLHF